MCETSLSQPHPLTQLKAVKRVNSKWSRPRPSRCPPYVLLPSPSPPHTHPPQVYWTQLNRQLQQRLIARLKRVSEADRGLWCVQSKRRWNLSAGRIQGLGMRKEKTSEDAPTNKMTECGGTNELPPQAKIWNMWKLWSANFLAENSVHVISLMFCFQNMTQKTTRKKTDEAEKER